MPIETAKRSTAAGRLLVLVLVGLALGLLTLLRRLRLLTLLRCLLCRPRRLAILRLRPWCLLLAHRRRRTLLLHRGTFGLRTLTLDLLRTLLLLLP